MFLSIIKKVMVMLQSFHKESWASKNWCFELWCWRRLLRVPWTARRSNSQSSRKSILNIHWKDWCWSWSSNTLVTRCKGLTHWKRHWCWERLMAGGEGEDRGWDGWMPSLTQRTWVWASSRSWWLAGMPNVLLSMGSQRVSHDWETELDIRKCSSFIILHVAVQFSQNYLLKGLFFLYYLLFPLF